RGDAAAVFRYQELERGRLLLDLCRGAGPRPIAGALFDHPGLTDLERQIQACEQEVEHRPAADGQQQFREALRQREELQLQRDLLLEEFLRDRSRRTSAALPALPELSELERRLPPGTIYVAPSLVGEEMYLLVANPGEPARVVRCAGLVQQLHDGLARLRDCLAGQLARYRC